MKSTIIKIVLLSIVICLAYFGLYDNITNEIYVREKMDERKSENIQKLKDLREIQLEYKRQKGYYADNADSLIYFLFNTEVTYINTEKADEDSIPVDMNKWNSIQNKISRGKINPSLAECMNMICFSVIGNDTTVSFAAQAGQFELNVMLPGMLKAVLDSTDMLTNFLPIFSANLIEGLTANQIRLRENIENSPVIVTLLTPKIGYLKSADLFKESLKTGKTIRELVVSKKLMTDKEVNMLLG